MATFHILVMPVPHKDITETLATLCDSVSVVPYCWYNRLTLAVSRPCDLTSGIYLLTNIGTGDVILKILFPDCRLIELATNPLVHVDFTESCNRILLDVKSEFVLNIAFPEES